MSRAVALERYRALPLPSTADEHWRFTDLRGFDPEAFKVDEATRHRDIGGGMLDVDVAALAVADEGGISVTSNAPEGVTFEPFTDHERLGELVGTEEKFAAHNAAVWEHGLLVVVPKGVQLEQPLAVRIVNSRAARSSSACS